VKTPFYLRKAAEPAAVAGLLLVSDRVADLLALVAAVRDNRSPTVYAVPGGFLLKLAAPPAAPYPGTIRLRALAADLFLPADAELIPALLPDEAAGLVRERGLIFLPGGRVLGYAAGAPLDIADLLVAPRRLARTWRPLPGRPARAERLRDILLDLPDDTPDAVLRAGGAGVGVEAPRPAAAGPLATAGGAAQLGLGKFLMGMGNLLRLKALARLGAALTQGAVEWAPRLSESVLGRQEAALRALLRAFRDGDLEEALRRALPLGEEGGRGGQAAKDANLPVHKPFYSLADLLGGKSSRASVWLGGGIAQVELAVEYRKAAEAATARGDYRRAAFIYGKLMRTYPLAAAVLSRGGLHHDAAILYLEKVGDELMAAREFAAAGEVDRAVALYQQRGEHALAGDILRQAGEESAALVEYRLAADRLAADNQNHAAGELMLKRAGRPDVAREYFAAGWARRPLAGAFPCLQSLARLNAEEDRAEPLLALLDEADAFFAAPGNDLYAAPFYNDLARLADRPNLAAARDDLRDRALRGLASKLRQLAAGPRRPGPMPSPLLGQSGEWPAVVVSDAAFAFRKAVGLSQGAPPAPTVRRVQVAPGEVTAACASSRTGRLCLGFASGLAMTFDPCTGSTHPLTFAANELAPVTSVAFDAEGKHLLILRMKDDGELGCLASYAWSDGGFRSPATVWRMIPLSALGYVTSMVVAGAGCMAGLWDGQELAFLSGPDLIPISRVRSPFSPDAFRGALIIDPAGTSQSPFCVLFDEETAWQMWPPPEGAASEAASVRFRSGWRPGLPLGSSLHHPPLACLRPDASKLDLLEVDEAGTLRLSFLTVSTFQLGHGALAFASGERYRAATFVGPDRLAAVRSGGVDWLRRGEGRITLTSTTTANLTDAVGCFFSPLTWELLVVSNTGDVVRVAAPTL
jgi:hypothetical protein